MIKERVSSGRLCDAAIRAFDRLCSIEHDHGSDGNSLTPRQRSRRHLLETRAHADEWLVPPELADTVMALVAAADRITDPPLAMVWTDHLPTAVLSCLERRSLARRLADGDPFLVAG